LVIFHLYQGNTDGNYNHKAQKPTDVTGQRAIFDLKNASKNVKPKIKNMLNCRVHYYNDGMGAFNVHRNADRYGRAWSL
jgi:hypothetical protein